MTVPVVLIAGGDGKGQDFSPLASAVAGHARTVVLIGRDARRIEAALTGTGVPVLSAPSLEDAVASATRRAVPAMRSCFHRPARATTCSETTHIARRCSSKPCARWLRKSKEVHRERSDALPRDQQTRFGRRA